MDELQVLHLAGDINTTLTQFPLNREIIASMKRLRSVRLEDLLTFISLPTFDHALANQLRQITLINLPLITTIPVVSHLTALETLVLNQLPQLQRLPMLPPNLHTLRVEMPTALCCNGYLGDVADSSACSWRRRNANSSSSDAIADECLVAYPDANATATCLSSDTRTTTQTEGTLTWLRATDFQCTTGTTPRFPTTGNNHPNANDILQNAVTACGGDLHRECSLTWPMFPDNVTGGMCLGHTWLQIVHCVAKDPLLEALRRDEIQVIGRGGCAPITEKWLES